MKPLQIGLLVLVGPLGGALIMKLTQRPKPVSAPLPIASAAPAPVVPAPAAARLESAPPAATPAPEAPAPKETPAKVVKMGHHSQPMQRTPPAEAPPVTTPAIKVAQNQPPADPGPSAPQGPEAVAPPMTPQPPPSVALQTGMTLPVRLGESLSSEHNQAGDTFTGTLDAPLSAGGFVIAEKGARVEGRVVEAQKSNVKGKAALALELTKLTTSDGQHVDIKTETLRKQSENMATGDQVGIVAAAAGIGAIIGAIAGGGKGAAIGAGAGGAAGGGGVVATRNKAVTLPTESKIGFRLSAPVTITEQLNR